MTNRILSLINEKYALTEKRPSEFSKFKAKGMTFKCKTYEAEGLGHVCVMRAKGFLGLMKMDTLVIAPIHKDLPLLSYDRIYAMGNDTLIIELYDTMGESKANLSTLSGIKSRFAHLPERFEEGKEPEHWYDSIRLPQTTSKKGKKCTAGFDAYTMTYISEYVSLNADPCDAAEKLARTDSYATGLVQNGGPATDVFKEQFGEETTSEIIRGVLFGVK